MDEGMNEWKRAKNAGEVVPSLNVLQDALPSMDLQKAAISIMFEKGIRKGRMKIYKEL